MSAVLLVEDEPAVAEPLAAALRREGYTTEVCTTGDEAFSLAGRRHFDLVVLDLGLPDVDGITVCRRLRAADADLPVLVLTARSEEIDVVVGLDAGADDYVCKPFRLAELFARMRALLRRSQGEPEVVVGGLHLNREGREATVSGVDVPLSTKEFDLLVLLARNAGDVVTRERILREVWSGAGGDSSRTIDTHVSSLRRKLTAAGSGPRLDAVRGVGFRLIPG